ncbi:MAG: ATP-binding protein [Neptunomonas phycophila]|uniref:ATP-binding protein n=1 Tax=Neptunomonas phycophila TaxID=1572645 RepID=UPI003B8B5F64
MELTKVKDYNTGIANNLGGDAYEIEADAEFFNHLSKRIYTDSMLAIVRELTCNAWDSHVEAGTADIPVIIQCPNKLQPVFKVVDRGVGMDIEALNNVYRKYGKSTKRKDMNQTGGLGVGSKTPFAYTDSFTVYSVKDGYKHTMINYKENGIPKIKEIITVETDEPNGVTVEVPVKVDDFNAFASRIESMANMFGGLLEVRGMDYDFGEKNVYRNMNDVNKLSLIDFEFPENMFRVPSHKARSFTSGNYLVLMGNVPYQLDVSKLNLTNAEFQFLNDISSSGYVTCIEVPIGCLDFSMSREHLEYSGRTTEYLENFISSMREDAREYIDDCLADATCEIDLYQKSCVLYNKVPSLYDKAPSSRNHRLIKLGQRKRNFRKLKRSWSSMHGISMVPLDRSAPAVRIYKAQTPEKGKIILHLVHYSNNKMLRKRLAKAYDDNTLRYSSGEQVICGQMSVDEADRIEQIVKKNMGENVEFLDLRRVNLDDVEVERGVSSEPKDKIVARAFSGMDESTGYTITVGELEDEDSSAYDTMFVTLPMHGRDMLYFKKYTNKTIYNGLRLFLANYSGKDGNQKYRIAGIGKSHQRLAKQFGNFVPVDEFVEQTTELRDMIQAEIDFCFQKSETETIYRILQLTYGETTTDAMFKLMDKAKDRPYRYGNEHDWIKDRLTVIQAMLPLFGYSSLMAFPPTSKAGRRFIVEYKCKKRNQPITAYQHLLREQKQLEIKVNLFPQYAEKRNNKLKFKRRKDYEEIKL